MTSRDLGILILASGKIVHNLRALDVGRPGSGFDWNDRFDAAAVTAPELLIAGPVHGSTSMTSFVLADHPTVVHDDNPKGATHG